MIVNTQQIGYHNKNFTTKISMHRLHQGGNISQDVNIRSVCTYMQQQKATNVLGAHLTKARIYHVKTHVSGFTSCPRHALVTCTHGCGRATGQPFLLIHGVMCEPSESINGDKYTKETANICAIKVSTKPNQLFLRYIKCIKQNGKLFRGKEFSLQSFI